MFPDSLPEAVYQVIHVIDMSLREGLEDAAQGSFVRYPEPSGDFAKDGIGPD